MTTMWPGLDLPWETCTCQHCDNGTYERVYGLGVRALREQAGWGLREMSRRLGDVSPAYLSDMELGRRNMSEEIARRILEICQKEPQ